VAKALDAPGGMVAAWWNRLKDKPGGRTLFSMLIGRMAPYTNTIGARVQELGPGHSRWVMRDRRKVRNHLNSIHAVALVNLAEVASGTAMLMGLSSDVRGIVTGLTIEYRKKARGTLTATCTCTVPTVMSEMSFDVPAIITDSSGAVVAEAHVTWKLARRSPASS
jgi:acyl-coenzyme A thioesterase PaaI-like protein